MRSANHSRKWQSLISLELFLPRHAWQAGRNHCSGVKSATVVGAEGWLCDAMATAVMVGGQDSAQWFGQPQLQGYQVFAVNRHEQSAWEI